MIAQAKLYLFGALLLLGGFGYWWHGHESYKAGKRAGDNEVAALKAQYATASQQAASAARAMQSQYDAQALADANRRALVAQFQLQTAQAKADAAQHAADQFRARLNEARQHDPTTARWLDTPLPARLRAAGQGRSG